MSHVSCTGRRVLYHWCHLGSPHAYAGVDKTARRGERPSPGLLDTGAQHTVIPTLVGEVLVGG